jgi:hypothetical protein
MLAVEVSMAAPPLSLAPYALAVVSTDDEAMPEADLTIGAGRLARR